MKNKYIYLAVIAALGLASCEPEFENEVSNESYSAGEADFSTYVAIGNSLTAGYMDGTVSKGGQMYSYPNLLAQQFAIVGGGAFTQPYFGDDVNNLGGLTLGGLPIAGTRLVIDASSGGPENIAGTPTIEVSAIRPGAVNNMGVPGAKSFHLLAEGYGNLDFVALGQANPYFTRHASDPMATVLGDAMSKNPTFFTNWIGSNDVLAYATSGGARPNNPATPEDESLLPADDHNATGNMVFSTYGSNDITNATAFAGVYSSIVNTLTSNGAKGVLATIPNVTAIPYFTTVPYAPLTAAGLGKALMPSGTAEQQAQAGAAAMEQLNTQLYNNLDAVFSAFGEPNRVNALNPNAANPVLIYDITAADRSAQITGGLMMQGVPAPVASEIGNAFGKARQATSADLIVLPASSIIGKPNANASATLVSLGANLNGVSYPMETRWVLTANEKAKVANATIAYNNAIRSVAASKGLALADMNAVMNNLISGLRLEDGQIYTADYFAGPSNLSTGLFSLDGVHPNPRGYAVIANEIIKVINSHYKAKLPILEIGGFPGVTVLGSN